MPDTLYLIASSLVAGALLTMGVLLQLHHVSRQGEWKSVRQARFYTFVACIVLAVSFLSDTMRPSGADVDVERVLWYDVSVLQALLFTHVCVVFVVPRLRTGFFRLLFTLFFGLSLVLTGLFFFMKNLDEFGKNCILLAFSAIYFVQLVSCTFYFMRCYKKGVTELEEMYEDEFDQRLRWVKRLFVGALAVGVLAAVVAILYSSHSASLFKVLVGVVYGAIVCSFINYRQVVRPSHQTESVSQKASLDTATTESVRAALDAWVEKKGYCETEQTVEEICDTLGVAHGELSQYFSDELGTTFRAWRTALRVEEAERLLRANPDIAVSDLMPLSGFSDRSNFGKHFAKTTGLSLKDYRKNLQNAD